MNADKKRKGWTAADYEAAGKTTVLLRLDKSAAQILSDAAEARGISRQALIEELLQGYEAKAEQPLLTPDDHTDKDEGRAPRQPEHP